LPQLVLNNYPPDLCLPSSWDYRQETLHPAPPTHSLKRIVEITFYIQFLCWLFCVVLGIKPRASCMLRKCYATQVYYSLSWYFLILYKKCLLYI
jgi:hypothetical protein